MKLFPLNPKTTQTKYKILEEHGSLHYAVPLLAIVIVAIVGTGLLVFSSASSNNCPDVTGNTKNQRISSEALHQWCIWNGGKNSNGKVVDHHTLLSWYTSGSPNEEWCADFVSYVFKAAGYPFTRGSYGWDEKASSQIVNMNGLKKEPAGYKPKVGDVVYLSGNDYPVGHVEIVIGTNPLKFIYGDSGTKDPTTGNGQMKEGPIPTDIQYYMSPN